MDCAAEPHFVECLFVAFYDGSHLVVAERVEFVVGDAGGLVWYLSRRTVMSPSGSVSTSNGRKSCSQALRGLPDIDHVDRVLFPHTGRELRILLYHPIAAAAERNAFTSSPVHTSG